jgi:hypothetical protein
LGAFVFDGMEKSPPFFNNEIIRQEITICQIRVNTNLILRSLLDP